ncbi:MAG: hypothetical protein LBQ66_05390 [Planctomycetaceae bacterium]|nr:hypothetical protein [Planctomycetaceae bacterium]
MYVFKLCAFKLFCAFGIVVFVCCISKRLSGIETGLTANGSVGQMRSCGMHDTDDSTKDIAAKINGKK